ncbi:MAG: LuxR C-terminal-related transcriptional regulator [Myxococcota bacterium]
MSARPVQTVSASTPVPAQDKRLAAPRELLRTLTQREMQTFSLVVRGMTTKQISGEMGVSPRTTEHHRRSLYRKLRIRNIAGVVRYAAVAGWFETR